MTRPGSVQWSTDRVRVTTRARRDRKTGSAPLFVERELLSNVKCSAIPSVVYEPSSSLLLCLRSSGLSNRKIGRPAARKRIRRKPPPPQIHPFLGGKERRNEVRKEGDNRALHFTGTKWRENVGGEWKNDRPVREIVA